MWETQQHRKTKTSFLCGIFKKWISGQIVGLPVTLPTDPMLDFWVLIPFLCGWRSRRQRWQLEVEFLLPTWKSWAEFPDPGFSLLAFLCVWGVNQHIGTLSYPVSFCMFQTNFIKKWKLDFMEVEKILFTKGKKRYWLINPILDDRCICPDLNITQLIHIMKHCMVPHKYVQFRVSVNKINAVLPQN